MTPIDTIVVPKGAEYQAVCRGLKKARANSVRVIPIPVGTQNTERALAIYDSELGNAQNILITGLCGSLSEQYSIGDVVLYQSCRNLKNQQIDLRSQLTTAISKNLPVNLAEGLTGDRIICQATEKLKLSQTYPVSVVDMEGYDYVKKLRQKNKNITVAIIRVVSDDLTGDIPNLSTAIDTDGNLQAIPMAIAFIQQPFAAIRLVKSSLIGLKVLKQTICQLNTC